MSAFCASKSHIADASEYICLQFICSPVTTHHLLHVCPPIRSISAMALVAKPSVLENNDSVQDLTSELPVLGVLNSCRLLVCSRAYRALAQQVETPLHSYRCARVQGTDSAIDGLAPSVPSSSSRLCLVALFTKYRQMWLILLNCLSPPLCPSTVLITYFRRHRVMSGWLLMTVSPALMSSESFTEREPPIVFPEPPLTEPSRDESNERSTSGNK